jgi:hypothetical protein
VSGSRLNGYDKYQLLALMPQELSKLGIDFWETDENQNSSTLQSSSIVYVSEVSPMNKWCKIAI